MKKLSAKTVRRKRRRFSIRKAIRGNAERPRITVYKSNHYTYVQAIDDMKGETIASASNIEKALRDEKNNVGNMEKIGLTLGERLKDKKITTAVFDRNGYLYHGKVKALADGVRKAGVQF